MKITFSGTGPMRPIPHHACKCPACLDAIKPQSISKRTRSSALLNHKNLNILIDASPDLFKQFKQNNIRKIDAVLITHPHQDAYGGIKQLDGWLKKAIPIYCQKQTWQIIRKKLKNLIFKEIKPYKKFIVINSKFLPLQVYHSIINEKKFPTLAFKVNNLIYCSDVKKIPMESLKYFKNTKTVILDAAMYFNRQIFSHLNTEDAILLSRKLKIKKLYLTQIGHSYPPHQIAQKEINQYLKIKHIKIKVFLAFDKKKIII